MSQLIAWRAIMGGLRLQTVLNTCLNMIGCQSQLASTADEWACESLNEAADANQRLQARLQCCAWTNAALHLTLIQNEYRLSYRPKILDLIMFTLSTILVRTHWNMLDVNTFADRTVIFVRAVLKHAVNHQSESINTYSALQSLLINNNIASRHQFRKTITVLLLN